MWCLFLAVSRTNKRDTAEGFNIQICHVIDPVNTIVIASYID